MESTRQKRIAKLLESDLAEIFQVMAQNNYPGVLISVTKVRVTPDLGLAKVYISPFPVKDVKELMEFINSNKASIRNELGARVRNQLRIVPDLAFYLDDSLDYIENIDKLLRGEGENPIQ